MVRSIAGGKRLSVLPLWLAKWRAGHSGAVRIRKPPSLYELFLYALGSNDKFSHTKATLELGYASGPLLHPVRHHRLDAAHAKAAKRPVPQSSG